MPIPIKSPAEVSQLRTAGRLLWQSLHAAAREVRPGVTTRDIALALDREVTARGLRPVLRGYVIGSAPPFPFSACVCVNDVVVHGVPGDRVIEAGDIVTVDAAAEHEGWKADAAVTVVLDGAPEPRQRAAHTARAALNMAMAMIRPGVRWSAIARDVNALIDGAGCKAVNGYSGHGIGRGLHEAPTVWFGRPARGVEDFILRPGMVLTVEPVVLVPGASQGALATLDDGWTVVTTDHSPAAHEERTVVVDRGVGNGGGCTVLTAD
jgi:methionyl aminopeptidase